MSVAQAVQPTVTQIKMIALCAQGKSREEIGRVLFLSPWTVKDHLDALRALLGARNVTHAVAICIVSGHLQIDAENERVSAVELELVDVAAA